MTIYNNLILCAKGNYRLWDKDFINYIDLSYRESCIVQSILTKLQKNILYGNKTYKIILSDYQIETLRNNLLFFQDV